MANIDNIILLLFLIEVNYALRFFSLIKVKVVFLPIYISKNTII